MMELVPPSFSRGGSHSTYGMSVLGAAGFSPSSWCRALTSAEKYLLKASCIVGGGGFVFGYNIGVMSGALALLEEDFSLSPVESGLVMSALAMGSVLGCLVGGPLCDSLLGRWSTIQMQNGLFLLGAVLTAGAPTLAVLVLGRFTVGVASSLSAVADIPYLQEVAPAPLRGRVSSSFEMLVVVGVLLSFAGGLLITDLVPGSGGWRLMFALPAPLVLLQLVGMLALPESPKFLVDSGQVSEAKRVLRLALEGGALTEGARGEVEWDAVLDDMVRDIQLLDSSRHCSFPPSVEGGAESDKGDDGGEIDSPSPDAKAPDLSTSPSCNSTKRNKNMLRRQVDRIHSRSMRPSTYSPLSTPGDDLDPDMEGEGEGDTVGGSSNEDKRGNDWAAFWEFKTPMLVIIGLMVFQQFTGGVVVRNYAPKIFTSVGFGYHESLLFNLVLGGMKVASTAVAIFFVDTVGRKPLLMGGITLSSAGMLMLVLSFATGLESNVGLFLCSGLLITAGYSLGFGPVCWVLQSECFPTTIRGRCMAASVLVSNLGQFVMALVFPLLMDSVHPGWIFFMFFILSLLAAAYVAVFIVETKGKQPKEILVALQST